MGYRDRMKASARKPLGTEKGMSLRDKINNRLLDLEGMMESQMHISNPGAVDAHIKTISKFWSALDDSDKDYIEGCRFAMEEKMHWNVEV